PIMAQAIQPAVAAPGRLVLPALCLGSFITTLAFAAPAPFLPAISGDLGVSVALLGQVTAVMMVLSAVLSLVVGPLADHLGARRFILIGLGATAVSLFDFGLAPFFSLLFIASIAGGIAEATVPGLSLAIAGTRFSGPSSRRAIGWTIGALASAPIIGVPALTTIGDMAGWRTAFLMAGGMAVVVMVVVAAWLPDEPRTERSPLRSAEIFEAYRPLLHDVGMRRLFACTLARSMCWLGLLTYLGALLEERFGLSTREIGLVYMLGGTGYFIGSLVAGGPFARLLARPLVAASNATLALLLFTVFTAVLNTAGTVCLIALAAFAGAVGWVGFTALLTQETPAGASTTMVFNMSLFNVGAAAGAGIGGVLLATGGFDAVAVILPLFGLVSALLVWIPRDRQAA
ncbi:MAG: MFS transporter, partial [Chloroflexota bacterium]|nr:MFS transporter [Chloroflexota bacterium]